MAKNLVLSEPINIRERILVLRDIQVIVDKDLAELYGVETKRLNEQVRRNIERFPEHFRFQLTDAEVDEVVANCDHLRLLKFSNVNPYVFTEQGVAMLSAVLRSETAVQVSIKIMESFVAMRKFLLSNAQIFQRLDTIELKQFESDRKINEIFQIIEEQEITPKQGIFYDGQIFDAYVFVLDLIKKARARIALIDNYVDESVLTLLSECAANVQLAVYTQKISQKFLLDVQKFESQYKPVSVTEFKKSHDRFLIIDDTVYHFGASLKDLGKKWFAFSKMQMSAQEIIGKLNN